MKVPAKYRRWWLQNRELGHVSLSVSLEAMWEKKLFPNKLEPTEEAVRELAGRQGYNILAPISEMTYDEAAAINEMSGGRSMYPRNLLKYEDYKDWYTRHIREKA